MDTSKIPLMLEGRWRVFLFPDESKLVLNCPEWRLLSVNSEAGARNDSCQTVSHDEQTLRVL
jgi:hypothetical protein